MKPLWPLPSDSNRPTEQTLAVLEASNSCWQTMPLPWQQQITDCWLPLACHLADVAGRQHTDHGHAAIIGIHGGQGSGKSTLCQALATLYQHALGWNVAVVSIDDLYLTKHQRQQLAQQIHPLLITRGVPGTHDVNAGITLFEQLRQLQPGQSLRYPAFDKIADDRQPQAHWHEIKGPIDVILFEGWCVGCQPGNDHELADAINPLEQQEDPDGRWRTWVNQQLASDYQRWFAMTDYLLMLKVPDMTAVQHWRSQQEKDNQKASASSSLGMSEDAIARFIQHYQRLTERALATMPEYADLVLTLNHQHQVAEVLCNHAQPQTTEDEQP